MSILKLILAYIIFYTFHEISHILIALVMGYRINNIKFRWIGFNINYKDEFILPLDDVLISLSGPLANLFFVWLFYFITKNDYLFRINLILFLFNILPFNFSDGGRIVKIIIKYFFGFYKAYIIVNTSGIMISVAILIILITKSHTMNLIIFILFFIYIIIESIIDYKYVIINVIKDLYLKDLLLKKRNLIKIKLKGMECKNKILDIIKCFCFNNYYVIYIFKMVNS